MADDKKKDKDKEKSEAAADENPEESAKKRKKKLIIFAALAALLVIGGGAGAFMFLSKGKKPATEEEISKNGVEHGDAHGESKAEEHGDGHGEAKKDEHGAAKKDEHGDGHGEAKKDEHGGGDGHGEAKKDEHGGGDGHGEAKKDDGKGGDGHGEAKKDDGKGGEKKKSEINIDFGETYKLQTFSLNLGNALENRYIRVEISLEYRGGDEQKQELDKRLPQLRDAIIGIIQRKTREFLLSPDGKEALRKEILIRVNRYMTKKIESVYITDLLIE